MKTGLFSLHEPFSFRKRDWFLPVGRKLASKACETFGEEKTKRLLGEKKVKV